MGQTGLIICCITAQSSCIAILNKGKEMATRMGIEVKAVSVQPIKQEALRRANDMKTLDTLSKQSGVEISIIYSDNPLLALAEYAEENLPIHIFTGKQADKSSFVMKLAEVCKLPVSMVAGETVFTVTN
ncbi:MAG: hypothetical protein IKV36_03480 [Clostridia bacterium]|nr:hypothetical protein [Clostridia bacterium]